MGRANHENWMFLGRANLEAAHLLQSRQLWRSAISRAYYSSMASGHALLLRMGMNSPERGNWPNQALPGLIYTTLQARHSNDRRMKSVALAHKADMELCWNYRILADYGPLARLGRTECDGAIKCAGRLVRRLEEQK